MVDDHRDTVVVERGGSNPIGWIVALVILFLLAIWFFNYGGIDMFRGTTTPTPVDSYIDADVDVRTPAQ